MELLVIGTIVTPITLVKASSLPIEKINGSYRYKAPAYFYKKKDGDLVAIVNATNNFLLLQ